MAYEVAQPKYDNMSLLRAIQILNSTEQHGKTLHTVLVKSPQFTPVAENELLRGALIDFLLADLEVVNMQRHIEKYFGWWQRNVTNRKRYALEKANLASIIEWRDQKFKKYEMLRRLVCFDNRTLEVKPS